MNNIFTPLAVTIIPVGPDGESPPRAQTVTKFWHLRPCKQTAIEDRHLRPSWVQIQQHPMHLPKGVLQCMCACIACVLLQPSVLTQSAQNISTALLCSEPCP